ncbi:MAG TPA: hypothetical protein VKO67_00365 [Smithellaceae bacterium]|nr:hypothetical protein [Smithellaceae bacterium]
MAVDLTVKAAAHVHSDWSYDGAWSLTRIADFFGKIGCRAVLMSEHDKTFDGNRWQLYQEACAKASTAHTLLVPGMEYSDPDNTVHVLVWGASAFSGKQQPTVTTLRKANERGGFCVLAHPSRRQARQLIDESWFPLLQGLEIWNRKADGFAPGMEALDLWSLHPHLSPFVGLDFHRPNQLFPLAMRFNIDTLLSPDVVFRAMHSRNFTATAMGIEAKYFKEKPLLSCMIAIERLRKSAARLLRKLRS